jgi:hypothetical protein
MENKISVNPKIQNREHSELESSQSHFTSALIFLIKSVYAFIVVMHLVRQLTDAIP